MWTLSGVHEVWRYSQEGNKAIGLAFQKEQKGEAAILAHSKVKKSTFHQLSSSLINTFYIVCLICAKTEVLAAN